MWQAYELKANVTAGAVLGGFAEQAAHVAWAATADRYPQIAAKMLEEVGTCGIYGTGFSKVTIAYDNPTNAHCELARSRTVFCAVACAGQCHGFTSRQASSKLRG